MGESDTSGIRVDPAELDRLAHGLRSELDGNLRNQVKQIKNEFRYGPGFGTGTASEPLRASHEEYAFCLHTAGAALDYYVDATEALIGAIALAADLYRGADAGSRLQYTGFEAAGRSYTATLQQLQAHRQVEAIRDAHISVPTTDGAGQ